MIKKRKETQTVNKFAISPSKIKEIEEYYKRVVHKNIDKNS